MAEREGLDEKKARLLTEAVALLQERSDREDLGTFLCGAILATEQGLVICLKSGVDRSEDAVDRLAEALRDVVAEHVSRFPGAVLVSGPGGSPAVGN